jgi:hypothetical protein
MNSHVRFILLPISLAGIAALVVGICFLLEMLFPRGNVLLGVIEYVFLGAALSFSAWLFSPYLSRTISLAVVILGTAVAWHFLKDAFYPEHHPRAYQGTLMPFFGAASGLFFGFLLALIAERRLGRTQHQPGGYGSQARRPSG